jgi:hypothetical protein
LRPSKDKIPLASILSETPLLRMTKKLRRFFQNFIFSHLKLAQTEAFPWFFFFLLKARARRNFSPTSSGLLSPNPISVSERLSELPSSTFSELSQPVVFLPEKMFH